MRIRLLGLLVAAAVAFPAALAGQPKDYAYVFLQGKLTDSDTGRPLVRVAVRLSSDDATFEAMTDERGVFTFEKLPTVPFDLRITTPDGKVIRGVKRTGPDDSRDDRFGLKLGQGYGTSIRIDPGDGRLAFDAPEPGDNWPRFWKQFAIFVGAAGLLAL